MPSAQPAHELDDDLADPEHVRPGLVLIDGGTNKQTLTGRWSRPKTASRVVLFASAVAFILAFAGRISDAGRLVAFGELIATITWLALLVLVIFVGRNRSSMPRGLGATVLCSLALTVAVRVAQSAIPAY